MITKIKRLLAGLSLSLFVILIEGIGLTLKAQHLSINMAHLGGYNAVSNPAFSLIQAEGNISLIGKRQWVGMDGAPSAVWANAHLGLKAIGATAGFQFNQQSIGVEKHTEAAFYFAKSIRLSEKDYIGLALKAGLVHFNGHYSRLDPIDQAFMDDINEHDALLGVGFIFYRPNVFYIGASMPRFTSGGIGIFGDTKYNFQNQYLFSGGYLQGLGASFSLRPSLIVSYIPNLGTTLDASAMLFAKQTIGLGIGIQSEGDLSTKIQVYLKGIGVGYNYQFNSKNRPLNRHINNSTHEIGLSFNFNRNPSLL